MNDENTQGTPTASGAPAEEGSNLTPTPEAPATPVVSAIGARLSGMEKTADVIPDAPIPKEAVAFDITKLTAEQLQSLKSQLSVTPEHAAMKKGNATTDLRKIQGKYVIDYQNSHLALVYDPARLSEVEALVLPVRFQGDEPGKFTNVLWNDFMLSDRVKCEILSIREVKGSRVEGEIVQRETGRLVAMEVQFVNHFFTVKLPDETTVEIEGKASNA